MTASQPQSNAINPLLKLALDMGPLVVYFWSYKRFADQPLEIFGQSYQGLIAAMLCFIPATLIAMAITYAITREISRVNIITLVLIVVIGGVTLFFNNDTFFKLRPTIFNLLFGGILAFGLYVQNRSYFQWLMGNIMPLDETGWRVLTKGFMILFFLTAAINEVIRNFMSDDVFVFWDTFGQIGLTFLFFAAMFPFLSKHIQHDEEGNPE